MLFKPCVSTLCLLFILSSLFIIDIIAASNLVSKNGPMPRYSLNPYKNPVWNVVLRTSDYKTWYESIKMRERKNADHISNVLAHDHERIIWFTDFDKTLTKKDTCTLVPEMLSLHKSNWNLVSQAYMKRYSERVRPDQATTLSQLLAVYDETEVYGLDLLEEYQVVKGISRASLWSLASKVELHGGAKAALTSLPLNIISVNWFRKMIRAVLLQHASHIPETIVSNEAIFDDSQTMTGELHRVCVTSYEKSLHIAKSNPTHPVIMVGDSLGDLHALLSVDIGIVIGESSSLKALDGHFFRLVPLSQFGTEDDSSLPTLYTVSDWWAILYWWTTKTGAHLSVLDQEIALLKNEK